MKTPTVQVKTIVVIDGKFHEVSSTDFTESVECAAKDGLVDPKNPEEIIDWVTSN